MKKLMLLLLAGYKRWLSPQLPAACRFTPTCSEYAAEAVARHGALRGALLAAWRLLRCHPLGGRGLDLVPEHFGRRLALLSRVSPARESAPDPGNHQLGHHKLGTTGTEAPAHAHAAHAP
jgi:hypothetical protein